MPMSDFASPVSWSPQKSMVASSGGIVTAQHWLAAKTGSEALARGANAADAAVSAAFSLTVAEPWLSGIGGCGYMLYYSAADRKTHSIDFGTVSPENLDISQYPIVGEYDNNWFSWSRVEDDRNLKGYPSICVPTTVAGLSLALSEFGTIAWEDAIHPAIEQAERGMAIDWFMSMSIAGEFKGLSAFEASRATFLPDGAVPVVGMGSEAEFITYQKLASTLKRLAKSGARDFYEGKLARDIIKDLNAGGNKISHNDLKEYQASIGQPVCTDYRGNIIHTAGDRTGGPTLISAIDKLSDSISKGQSLDANAICAQTSAMRTAYDSRLENPAADSCTSHISVIDSNGNLASLTGSLLSRFGSKVVLPSTGILMNNGLMWFDPTPGRPNSLRAGAKPLANMCPVIVTRNDQPYLAIGAAGGRQIMPAIMQILSYLIDFDMNLEEAFHYPRVSAEENPVRCNSTMKADHMAALAEHFQISRVEDSVYPVQFAVPSAVLHDPKTGENYGMAHVNSPWSAAVAASQANVK